MRVMKKVSESGTVPFERWRDTLYTCEQQKIRKTVRARSLALTGSNNKKDKLIEK